jgi:hypothetical protein
MIGDGNNSTKIKKLRWCQCNLQNYYWQYPSNRDAYNLGLIVVNYQRKSSCFLQYTNRSLLELPNDRELIERKIGLLENLQRRGNCLYSRS